MKNHKVNYNGIYSNYNCRYKSNPLRGVSKALGNIIGNYKPRNILEVGCGTGHWLSELDSYDITIIGVDSEIGMLKEAQKISNNINLICGDANLLPFSNKKFDMIYCVNAIQHFSKKREFILNAANLLEQNGTLSIVGVDPHDNNDRWYVYDFFDGVYEKDLVRYPLFQELAEWMEEIGLKQIRKKPIQQIYNEFIGEDILNDTFLRKDQSSQLASLSDAEYRYGIEKIRHAIEVDPNLKFIVKLTFKIVTGVRI